MQAHGAIRRSSFDVGEGSLGPDLCAPTPSLKVDVSSRGGIDGVRAYLSC